MGYLDEVNDDPVLKPPRILLHGPPKVGKSTLAADIPGNLFMPVEEGADAIKVAKLPRPHTFEEALQEVAEVVQGEHQYRGLCVDSADVLESLIWQHVCEEKKVNSIEDLGYGKGYTMADRHWHSFVSGLDACRRRGMAVVVIAHSQNRTQSHPILGPHDVVDIRLHKRACAILEAWADIIAYMDVEQVLDEKGEGLKKVTTVMGTERRMLHLAPAQAYKAGSRWPLPEKIEIPKNHPWAPFKDAIVKAQKEI